MESSLSFPEETLSTIALSKKLVDLPNGLANDQGRWLPPQDELVDLRGPLSLHFS